MNGFINKTLAVLTLAGGLSFFVGCTSGPTPQDKYYNCVDPCWPQRYSAMAADSTCGAFGPQVENGHILEQTVWNSHFDRGTAVLTPGGLQHLASLSHRLPSPDPRIFLQTSYDMAAYDPANPAKYSDDRAKLDQDRRKAILDYLSVQSSGSIPFQVIVHDPHEVSLHTVPMLKSVSEFSNSFKGSLPFGGIGGSGGASSGK